MKFGCGQLTNQSIYLSCTRPDRHTYALSVVHSFFPSLTSNCQQGMSRRVFVDPLYLYLITLLPSSCHQRKLRSFFRCTDQLSRLRLSPPLSVADDSSLPPLSLDCLDRPPLAASVILFECRTSQHPSSTHTTRTGHIKQPYIHHL